jgi:lysylphosphatidylglycerol synthetase-like protein (DUF2156 family)
MKTAFTSALISAGAVVKFTACQQYQSSHPSILRIIGTVVLSGAAGTIIAAILYRRGQADWTTSKMLVISAIVIALFISGCAVQSQQAAPAPVVAQAPQPKPQRRAITSAEILAAQPPEIQSIINEHRNGRRWPVIRHGHTVMFPYSPDSNPLASV